MRRARLALLTSLALSTSCIEERTGYISVFVDQTQVVSEFVDAEDGLALQITMEPSIDSDGNVLLDSALIVVNADGQTTSLADPEIEATGYPVAQFGETEVTLTVPSPIQEIDTFDAFCAANGRSAEVTLRFFSDSIDPDTSVAPPLTEVVTNVLLTMRGTAPAPDVFSSSGVGSFSPGTTAPKIESLTAGPGDTVLFVIDRRATSNLDGSPPFAFFRADHDSVETLSGIPFFEDTPQVASNSDGSLFYLAGRIAEDRLDITSSDFSAQMQIETNGAPEFDALRVARLTSTATGLRAIVQSAFQLEVDPAIVPGGVVDPPEGKYYGSFIFQLDDVAGLTVTSVELAERDIVSIIDMPDGGSLVTSTELPPRSEETVLRVERFDDAGALVWTHDEPVSANGPDTLVFADGSVLLSYEHLAPAGIIDVVRLSASDGSETYRAAFSGSGPSAADSGGGRALLSFVGTLPAAEGTQIELPERAVPLLVELDDTGAILRGAQLACGGSASLENAADGSVLLVASFADRFTVGDRSETLPIGQMTVIGIE